MTMSESKQMIKHKGSKAECKFDNLEKDVLSHMSVNHNDASVPKIQFELG